MRNILILLFSVGTTVLPAPVYKVEMIAELFRHGARTSIKNPLNEEFNKVIGEGNLTPNGMRMHEVLGQQLSQYSYPDLFKAPYSQRNYIMYSSGVLRTLLSAQCHIGGLYPLGTGYSITVPNDDAVKLNPNPTIPPFKPFNIEQPTFDTALNKGLMVVPVLSNAQEFDTLFRAEHACPKASLEFNKNTDETEATLNIQLQDQLNLFTQNMTRAGYSSKEIFGHEIMTVNDVHEFKDAIVTHTNYFGKRPDGIDENFYAAIDTFGSLHQVNSFDGPFLKFSTSNLMKKIFHELHKKVKDYDKYKDLYYAGFSGHDSNVTPFQIGLGVTSTECVVEMIKFNGKSSSNPNCQIVPHFASDIIYELSSTQDSSTPPKRTFFIRVLLNGVLVDICPAGKATAEGYCPYDDAKSASYDAMTISDEDFDKMCYFRKEGQNTLKSSGDDNSDVQQNNPDTIYNVSFYCIVVFLVVLDILLVAYITYKNFLDKKIEDQKKIAVSQSENEAKETKEVYAQDEENGTLASERMIIDRETMNTAEDK